MANGFQEAGYSESVLVTPDPAPNYSGWIYDLNDQSVHSSIDTLRIEPVRYTITSKKVVDEIT